MKICSVYFLLALCLIQSSSKVLDKFKITIAAESIAHYPDKHISAFDFLPNQIQNFKTVERYFDTINRKIVLDDGRVVTCNVPLYSVPEQQTLTGSKNLTDEEAKTLLMPLKDTCIRHRTKEFLWEYCHEKYARQYDDGITVINANKRFPESFFLGFYDENNQQQYEKIIDAKTGEFHPHRDFNEFQLRYEFPTYRFVSTHNHIVRLYNIKPPISWDNESPLELVLYIPTKYISSNWIINPQKQTYKYFSDKNTTQLISKRADKQEHTRFSRIIKRFVSTSVLLLEEPFPMDVTTEDCSIQIYTIDQTLTTGTFSKYLIPNIYSYKNYLFGTSTLLSEMNNLTTVFLVPNFFLSKCLQTPVKQNKIINRTILDVFDDVVVELDEAPFKDDKIHEYAYSTLISNRNAIVKNDLQWIKPKNRIIALGRTIIGINTNFTQDISIGDILLIISESPVDIYHLEVMKIVSDNILITRIPQFRYPVGRIERDAYFVGKFRNQTELINKYHSPRPHHIKPILQIINPDFPRSFLTVYNEKERDELLCGGRNYFREENNWLMSFSVKRLQVKQNRFNVKERNGQSALLFYGGTLQQKWNQCEF